MTASGASDFCAIAQNAPQLLRIQIPAADDGDRRADARQLGIAAQRGNADDLY